MLPETIALPANTARAAARQAWSQLPCTKTFSFAIFSDMLWVVVLQVEGVASTLSITGTTHADRVKAAEIIENFFVIFISCGVE
jgi:hypothetical protein